ncbi:MAG: hypothetical protein ACRCYU_22550, partial [Nocardioides sp.]
TPDWVGHIHRAQFDDGLTGVDWVNRPSPNFPDQVVQTLLIHPNGRTDLHPPVVYAGELPEIIHTEDWLAYTILTANIAGILGRANEATRTLTRRQAT